MMMTPTARRASVLLGLALLGPACRPSPSAVDASAATELETLQRRTTTLQRQVELAAGKDFYLLFDPAASTLRLMLRGAELRAYPVLAAQVGRPRVAWVSRSVSALAWQGVAWSHGTLEPSRQIDRLVVQGGEPAKPGTEVKAPPIPPTAEELYPVPARYLIRFADGLSVEIRPREADTDLGWWARTRHLAGTRVRDLGAALQGNGRDVLRLRLVLQPKDAESLYRSLPPGVRLMVV